MTGADESRDGGGIPPVVAWVLALASLAGGIWWIGKLDTTGVTGGILLLVAALGFLAVALGQGPYGPDTEGRLDLSARLAAGLLGGALGGMAHLLAAAAFDAVGIPDLVGVEMVTRLTGAGLGTHAASGAGWGLLLGVLYPRLPGAGPVARSLGFSLVPALWVLLMTFPGMNYGVFGMELGALTFLFVILYHLVWGAVAGSVLRWARDTEHGPVSRPLGA